MKISGLGRYARGVSVAAAMLAGCVGMHMQPGPPTSVVQNMLGATTSAIHPGSAKIILVGTGWAAPSGVAVDSKGNVYVGDFQLAELKEVSPPFTGRTHGKIRVLARQLGSPNSVAVDGKGNVYVGINESPPAATLLQITPAGVKNTVTKQIDVYGIAVDSSQNVYAASDANVYKIAHKSGGGWKAPVRVGPDFSQPIDVARDAQGSLYIAELGTNAIEKLEPSGKLVTVGSGFTSPSGVAISLGCKITCAVFVADAGHNEVKKVTPPFTGAKHGKITEIGYGFNGPERVAAKGTDVYVVDTGNVQVKEVIP
jgi:hypothetical protein